MAIVTKQLIRAGTHAELREHLGDWAFIDLGFSHSAKTCGYLFMSSIGDEAMSAITYGEMTSRVLELAQQAGPPLHLVLEAPLSAAFDAAGNPVGREIEKDGAATRYWYVGLGCSVLVASLYLLTALRDATRAREVRIFEGLVSFKDQTKASDHQADVAAMKRVVWSGGQLEGRFISPTPLQGRSTRVLTSTLALLGLDPTPPPIVQVIRL